MRILPFALSLLLTLLPAAQAYGKTMAAEHCRAHGHVAQPAADASHEPVHAQHHASAGAAAHHSSGSTGDSAGGAHCECGCVCDAVCAGGAAVSATSAGADVAPPHEPWIPVTDSRHPVAVQDFLLRPPRSLS